MREYYLTIDEALRKGLSPEEAVAPNSQFLYECLGFRCERLGLEPYKSLTNPLPVTTELLYDWPFPQYITGEAYNFLIVRDSIVNHEDVVYSVSDDHLTVTYIFGIDQLTFGQGTLMEVADFGEYVFMTNGVIMIYWNTVVSDWSKITASATIPMMRTICNFKGQAVGGNIVSSWHDCDETFYVWSKIGEIDFTPERDNEAGYRRCPYGGEVYHVRRLGSNVIGYSSKGITQLYPVREPAATFGFGELHDVGLINRGAIDGNLREHCCVDDDYNVWKIGLEISSTGRTSVSPKMLGYKHYMEELSSEDIIVKYDQANGDFYIGNSEKTFILSPFGMTEAPQHPSALWRRDKDTYILPDTEGSYSPLIVSESFDMNYGGQKTMFSLESSFFGGNSPEMAVDYSFNLSDWATTDYTPLNNQGVGSKIVAGNAFRTRLKFSSLEDHFKIGSMITRYKMTDLRGLRGVYAPPPRGQ